MEVQRPFTRSSIITEIEDRNGGERYKVYALHYSGACAMLYAIVVARNEEEAILAFETTPSFEFATHEFDRNLSRDLLEEYGIEFDKSAVLNLAPQKTCAEVIDVVWYFE